MKRGKTPPPVFHITHWKAGSQWIFGVLRELFPTRVVQPLVGYGHVTGAPIQRGRIYPTVYMDKGAFDALGVPADSVLFVVIRDLRDALISSYYSLLESHPLVSASGPHPGVARLREELRAQTKEEGLLYLIEETLDRTALIQSSWMESAARVFRFESLVEDESGAFTSILEHVGLPVDEAALSAALSNNSFQRKSGRARGVEDTGSHFRKGVPGDWRNHLHDDVKAAFKERFGAHLIRTGYEVDDGW